MPRILQPGPRVSLRFFEAQKTNDDLRSRAGDSPLGALDAYQWLLFTGAHNERHLGQMREVKADPKFPKS
jgi:hypothetical protein